MKYLLFSISLIITVAIHAQDTKGLTRSEQFLSNSGSLLEKTFQTVGKLEEATFQVVGVKDLTDETSLYFSVISRTRKSYSGITYDDRSIVDDTEIPALLKAVQQMIERLNAPGYNSCEIFYKTNGGFEVGIFWTGIRWGSYIQLERSNNDSVMKFDISDLNTLADMFKKSLELMSKG